MDMSRKERELWLACGRSCLQLEKEAVEEALSFLHQVHKEDRLASLERINHLEEQLQNAEAALQVKLTELEAQKKEHQSSLERIRILEEQVNALEATDQKGSQRPSIVPHDLPTAPRKQDVREAILALSAPKGGDKASQEPRRHVLDSESPGGSTRVPEDESSASVNSSDGGSPSTLSQGSTPVPQESQCSLQGAASPSLSQRATDCPTSPDRPPSDSHGDRSPSSSCSSEEEACGEAVSQPQEKWQHLRNPFLKSKQEADERKGSQRNSLNGSSPSSLSQGSTPMPQDEHPMPVWQPNSQNQRGFFLPDPCLPVLFDFLPVAEVAEMGTRAVSFFFSNPQVWVAHIFKLMEVDSVLQHDIGSHPAYEFVTYKLQFYRGAIERAMEVQRNGSEGFQGYRLWFNGHHKWHSYCPEMSSHFVNAVMDSWFEKQILDKSMGKLMCIVMIGETPDLRLHVARGLLPILKKYSSSPLQCKFLITRLMKGCLSAFPFLSKDFVLQLLDLWTSWVGLEGDDWHTVAEACEMQILHIIEASLPIDQAICACRYFIAIGLAKTRKTNMKNDMAAAKQKLVDLLT